LQEIHKRGVKPSRLQVLKVNYRSVACRQCEARGTRDIIWDNAALWVFS
jgi:hypothetical protein